MLIPNWDNIKQHSSKKEPFDRLRTLVHVNGATALDTRGKVYIVLHHTVYKILGHDSQQTSSVSNRKTNP
jgi:hypothetical protein